MLIYSIFVILLLEFNILSCKSLKTFFVRRMKKSTPCISYTNGKRFSLQLLNSNYGENKISMLSLQNLDKDLSKVKQYNSQLEYLVDEILSKSTIKTASSYMLEFRNDIEYQYVMDFENCGELGFANQTFTSYITKMIHTEKQDIEVIMKISKMYRKQIDPLRINQARLRYKSIIEPRKIANQLINIREDIAKELLHDLNSIMLEHEEAERYAIMRCKEGKYVADKSRKLTRYTSSTSTPFREKNYQEISVLLTNFALDLIKIELNSTNNSAALNHLDDMIKSVSRYEEEYMESLNQDFLPEGSKVPDYLFGEIYHFGLANGVMRTPKGETFNAMKLANDFFNTRLALGILTSNILNQLLRDSKSFYAMIKEYGGFSRLDFSIPDISVIYIDDVIDDNNNSDDNLVTEEIEDDDDYDDEDIDQDDSNIFDYKNNFGPNLM